MKTGVAACAALAFCASAFAQEYPVPKMFKSMAGQKGQYKVEIVEGSGGAAKARGQTMTVCTDNLMDQSAKAGAGKAKPRADDCKHRLLKDTADEAVIESACKDRTSTVSMKREGPKSVLMTMTSTSSRGPESMKMRYTHLGACREGQSAMGMEPDSEQCKQMKAQMAQMDPAKQCAGAGAQRQMCEQQIQSALAQMKGMCN